jgi:glutamyl-tRNA reductase
MASHAADMLSADLRHRGELVAAEVLRRNRTAWVLLDDDDRRRLELLIYAVAARLVDEPRSRLQHLDGEQDSADLIAAMRELFGLDGVALNGSKPGVGETLNAPEPGLRSDDPSKAAVSG